MTVRDPLEDLSADGRIARRILKEHNGRAWTGFIWLRIGRSMCNKLSWTQQ